MATPRASEGPLYSGAEGRASGPRRVLVNGTRGKSTVTLSIAHLLREMGFSVSSKVTGVLPLVEDGRGGLELCRFSGRGSVGEALFWLSSASGLDFCVLECNAVSPSSQRDILSIYRPEALVYTNFLPDHQEEWGSSPEAPFAAMAWPLLAGTFKPSTLVLGPSVEDRFLEALRPLGAVRVPPRPGEGHEEENARLSAWAVSLFLGLPLPPPLELVEMARGFGWNPGEVREIFADGKRVVLALSANDPKSALRIASSRGIDPARSALVYVHRFDRPMRLSAFEREVFDLGWSSLRLIGDLPPLRRVRQYRPGGLLRVVSSLEERTVFCCGNVRPVLDELASLGLL